MQAAQVVALGSLGSVEGLVATISQYLFAPLTLDQLKVGLTDTPLAPLAGADNDGAGNSVCRNGSNTASLAEFAISQLAGTNINNKTAASPKRKQRCRTKYPSKSL